MIQAEATAANDDAAVPAQAEAVAVPIETPAETPPAAPDLSPPIQPPFPRAHVKPQGPLIRLIEPAPDAEIVVADAKAAAPAIQPADLPEIVRDESAKAAPADVETDVVEAAAPEDLPPPVRPAEPAPPPTVLALPSSPAKVEAAQAVTAEQPPVQPVEPTVGSKDVDAPQVRAGEDATTLPPVPTSGQPTTAPVAERAHGPVKQTVAPSKDQFAAAIEASPAPVAEVSPDATTQPTAAYQPNAKPTEVAPAPVMAATTPNTAPAPMPAPEARVEAALPRNEAPSTSQVSRASIETTTHIAAQILKTLDGRSSRFEMALRPEDLGRVDVSLDIDADGQLNARLAFDNPLAATELKGRADELRRQLEAFGFKLNDDALDFAQRDDSSSAFDRGASAQDREGRQNRNHASSRLTVEAAAPAARWQSFATTPDRVDLRI